MNEKQRQYQREWRAKNKDKVKAQNKRWYQRKKAEGKTGIQRDRLDHYIVYYIPEEHYVGHTNTPAYRMSDHRNKHGRNTDNWRVLYTTKTKKEAVYYEALFCSTLAIDGLKIR